VRNYLVISKSDGGFRVENDFWVAKDSTLELALIKAIQQAGIKGVELAPTLQAAEVLESLLGANE
jgi:hypothetical protein